MLNYLEDEYWDAFPTARASEFARFVRLVQNGVPFMGTMLTIADPAGTPPEYGAARKAQQLFDLERSVKYCREELGIGS